MGEPARAGGAMSVRQHSARLTGRRSLARGARERGVNGRLNAAERNGRERERKPAESHSSGLKNAKSTN